MTASLKHKISAGLAWSFAQQWGVRVISFVQLVVVTRLLSPADIGIVSFVVTMVALVEGVIDLGLNEAIQQAPALEEKHIRSAFSSVMLVALVLLVLMLCGSPFLATWSARPYLRTLLPLLALTIPLNASVAIPNALLGRNLQYDAIAYRSVTSALVGAVVGIGTALAGWAYWSIALRILTEALVGCALTWRISPWRAGLGFSKAHWFELFRTSRFVLGMRVLNLINMRLDSLILGVRVAPAELGIYTTGQRAHGVLMDSLFGAVNQVTLPAFSRIGSDLTRSCRVLLQVIRTTSYVTFPAFALAAALSTDLTLLIYGDAWRSSGPVLGVLCIGGWLFSISFFNATMLTATGHAGATFGLVALNAVTNALAFYVGSRAGALGVAMAYVARGYLVYPINLLVMRRTLGLPILAYLRCLAPTAFSSWLAAFSCWIGLEMTSERALLTRVAAGTSLGIATYAAACMGVFRRQTYETFAELSTIHPALHRLCSWLRVQAATDQA